MAVDNSRDGFWGVKFQPQRRRGSHLAEGFSRAESTVYKINGLVGVLGVDKGCFICRGTKLLHRDPATPLAD